jgi:hypothetical protein
MKETTTIYKWRSPASEYPRSRRGSARIATAWYEPGVYDCYKVKNFDYFFAVRRLYITTLKIDGKVWMVDDPPHWWAMQEHAEAFEGHVVCAGLGLGLMVHALLENPKVTRITVVERNLDVIDLIDEFVADEKLEIINEDWYEFDPRSIPDADGVLFDLYVGSGVSFFGAACQECAQIYERWNNPEMTVRVHGLPNPLVGDIGRTIAIAERIAR